MTRAALVLVVVAAMGPLSPSVATAQGFNAPPGNSGIDEYLEAVPSADGPRHMPGGRPTLASPQTAAGARRTIPSATLKRLRKQGADGDGAGALAVAGAPDRRPSTDLLNPGRGGGFVSGVGRVIGGSGDSGPGLLFPLALLAPLLVLAGVLVRRRRGSGGP